MGKEIKVFNNGASTENPHCAQVFGVRLEHQLGSKFNSETALCFCWVEIDCSSATNLALSK